MDLLRIPLRPDCGADDWAKDPLAIDPESLERSHVFGDLGVLPSFVVSIDDDGPLAVGMNAQVRIERRHQRAQLLSPHCGRLAIRIARESL